MKSNLNNIDHLFKDGLGSYTETPPPDVWEALEKRLDDRQKRPAAAFRWPWFIALLFIAGFFSSLLALNMSGNSVTGILGLKTNTVADDQKTSSDAISNVTPAANTAQNKKDTENKPAVTAHKTHKRKTHQNTGTNYDNNTTLPTASATVTTTNQNNNTSNNTIAATNNSVTTGDNDNSVSKTQAENHYTAPVKYVVKNKIKNNIQIAEAEPVLSSGNNYAANIASSIEEEEEEQMTFGKNVVYASTSRTPVTRPSITNKPTAHTANPATSGRTAVTNNPVAGKMTNATQPRNTTVATTTQQTTNKVPVVNATTTVAKTNTTTTKGSVTTVSTTTTTQTKTQPATPVVAAINKKNNTQESKPTPQTGALATTPTDAAANTNGSVATKTAVTTQPAVKNNSAVTAKTNTGNKTVAKTTPVVKEAKNTAPAHTSSPVVKTQPAPKTAPTVAEKENTSATTPVKETVVSKSVNTKTAIVKAQTLAAAKTQPAPKTPAAVIDTKIAAVHEKAINEKTTIGKSVKSKITAVKTNTFAAGKSQTASKTVLAIGTKNVNTDANRPADKTSAKKTVKTKTVTVKNTATENPVKEKVTAKQTKQNNKTVRNTNTATATITGTKNKTTKNKTGNTKTTKTTPATQPNNYSSSTQPAEKQDVVATVTPPKVVPQAQNIIGTFKADSALSMKTKETVPAPAAVTATDSNSKKHKLLDGYDYGMKLGYEGGFSNKASEKLVISGFIEHKFKGKFSYMLQPALKSSYVNNRSIDGVATYYDTTAASIQNKNYLLIIALNKDTFYKHDFTYTQSHDSIVKSYGVGGHYMEFELPVMLKYKITDKLSVYGGANIGLSKFIAIKENTYKSDPISRTVTTITVSHQYEPASTPPSYSVLKYTGAAIGDYKGPMYPTQSGVSFRLGYMFGFSYELRKKWLLDALVQQSFAKSNMQGGYNTNTALSVPYFRLTVGYRLSK